MLEECWIELIDENWRSCYWNQELGLYLVVYVDDFSMCGRAESLAEGWRRIKDRITLGEVEPMNEQFNNVAELGPGGDAADVEIR